MKQDKNNMSIERKNVNIINMIYREWLEAQSTEAVAQKINAQIELLKTLDEKQKALFCNYVDCSSRLESEAQVQLICFVLEIVNQINNLPKSED